MESLNFKVVFDRLYGLVVRVPEKLISLMLLLGKVRFL
jgi:hypothetical protein